MSELDEYRMQLNDIDARIAKLLENRFAIVTQVAAYKQAHDIPVLDEGREKVVLDRVSDNCINPDYRSYIRDIYVSVMERSRAYQKSLIANIYLIGMPGCGKSTVGRKLASVLGREFIDADEFFELDRGDTPEHMINESGEESFRDMETAVLREIAARSGCVIALGGGVVVRPENREILGEDSTIIYVKRNIESLTTEGRPLSLTIGVAELYARRHALYEDWADITIDNLDIDAAVADIIDRL